MTFSKDDYYRNILIELLDILQGLAPGDQESARAVAERAQELRTKLGRTGDEKMSRLGDALSGTADAYLMHSESKSLMRRAAAEPRNFSKFFHESVRLQKAADLTQRRALEVPLSEGDREKVLELARKLVTQRRVNL